MSKAEEKADKAYLVSRGSGIDRVISMVNRKNGYILGYMQAERDLGWISVKDRLPEEGHFVLTCVADNRTPQCVGMALLLKDGTWWDGDMKVRVDYWMEVPKLPKDDEK